MRHFPPIQVRPSAWSLSCRPSSPPPVPAHAACRTALGVPGLLLWLQPHRLSVASKLKATLWVCGLGLIAIAAVYAWTGHASTQAARSQASYQHGSDLAASVATQVAEARRLQTQYA